MEVLDRQRQLSLLLVDDDVELCGMMREFFAQEGHRLECIYNGREGLTAALSGSYDLVILDVMLPILDGFEVLQRLRRRKDLPVIMLTARVQQQDRMLERMIICPSRSIQMNCWRGSARCCADRSCCRGWMRKKS
jgi:CheY-like chemotaxis protein